MYFEFDLWGQLFVLEIITGVVEKGAYRVCLDAVEPKQDHEAPFAG